jgi:hypothetical protein
MKRGLFSPIPKVPGNNSEKREEEEGRKVFHHLPVALP